MNFKIITIPFDDSKELFLDDELNKFILNKKIISKKLEFFTYNSKPYWSVLLEYEHIHPVGAKHFSPDSNVKQTVENLSEPDKLLFQKLKDWRKETAEKQGFPVYIVANNKEMVTLVEKKPITLEALKNIEGFGKKKLDNYGKEIIEIIKNFKDVI